MGALAAVKATCPVCGHASNRPRFSHGEYAFLRCGGCGLVHASPRPTPAELEATYADAYFDDRGWLDPTADSAYMRRCWDEVSPRLAGKREVSGKGSKRGAGKRPAKGRLLDVGCATGAFIQAAQQDGWDACGLEYSETAAARARAAGLHVRSGSLEDGAYAGETFDVITAWHVVEHLVDPIDALMRMRALAAPDAVLVIETPNLRSIGALLKGDGWSQIRPPEHINFFDRAALTVALARAGWRVTEARTIYRRDSAARIAGRAWLAPAARAAARLSEMAGMGGNLRMFGRAV